MHTRSIRQRLVGGLVALIVLSVLSLLAVPATANHSWGNYHFGTKTNSFTLKTGDNVTAAWDSYLDEAISDWNASTELDLVKVAGSNPRPKNCRATAGRIEVCNASYGNNGWLGLAQIWVSGSHITQGVSKLNDYYFNQAGYNTPAWRGLVMCQEIAHDFGLDHQDETFNNANLGSCMDYTNDPDGGPGGASSTDPSNDDPNGHDFEQLDKVIYTHLDSSSTIDTSTTATGAAEEDPGNDPQNWGRILERDGQGRPSLYGKDLAPGEKLFTFVIYAEGAQEPTVDDGTGDGTGDGGQNDGGRNDGGKRDGGKKADSKQDGGKKDGGKQRQGHHDRHRHR
jgi:hypothetical protein